MTDNAPMFNPFLAAGEVGPATDWKGLIIGVIGGTGFTAVTGGVVAYFKNRADQKTEETKGQSSVQIKKLEVTATERESLLKAIQDKEKRTDDELRQIREQMEGMRKTFSHRLRGVQQYMVTLNDLYHACFLTLSTVNMQVVILRARLKKIQKEDFDDAEFPVVNIEDFNPRTLPRFQDSDIFNEDVMPEKPL